MSKEIENTLKEALKSARELSKAERVRIKNPAKLCDSCLNEFVWQTKEGFFLCE